MTRLELCNNACNIARENTTEMLELAAKAADKFYKIIWNNSDWQDTLGIVAMTPAAYQGADVILPDYVERVQAVRCNKILIPSVMAVTQLAYDPMFFDATGTPSQFRISPVLAADVIPLGGKVGLFSTAITDTGSVFLKGSLAGLEFDETVTLNGQNVVNSVNSYDWFSVQGKDESDGDILMKDIASGKQLSRMRPWQTTKINQHFTLSLIPDPKQPPVQLLILVKNKCPGLINDFDTIAITGCEDVLHSFVLAEVYKIQKNAMDYTAEITIANNLLTTLKGTEETEGAKITRIIPFPDTLKRGDWMNTPFLKQ